MTGRLDVSSIRRAMMGAPNLTDHDIHAGIEEFDGLIAGIASVYKTGSADILVALGPTESIRIAHSISVDKGASKAIVSHLHRVAEGVAKRIRRKP